MSDSANRRAGIVARDKAHVWHPYTPMDRYIDEVDPIVVARAKGSFLEDVNGKTYLDGNSSWYVACLGHGHPRILEALRKQVGVLAHCSLAGVTHEPAAMLAEELVALAPPGLSRVFYTDNGSTSVEVAVRIALQMWQQLGAPKKTRFVTLEGGYHGDTLAPTSLGGVEIFRRPLAGVVFECVRAPFPDADGYARALEVVRSALEAEDVAAVVVEPLVQGTAGMRMYDPEFLRELRRACDTYRALLIVDEVFTGYGRTGKMWGCDHAGITPDVMCLGKSFAALFPMGATLTTERVFDAFRGGPERALYYGHTFCGNPLGAALAREVLAIYRDERIIERTQEKSRIIAQAFERIARLPSIARVRTLGMIGAADFRTAGGYLGEAGWRVYEEAKKRGAYIRPLGDTVYVTPPLTIEASDLERLLSILEESIVAAR
jgi:adenosylmethionine---8-amino-7-oxononanoate aminotransferase